MILKQIRSDQIGLKISVRSDIFFRTLFKIIKPKTQLLFNKLKLEVNCEPILAKKNYIYDLTIL
jgi:hypothetical protein